MVEKQESPNECRWVGVAVENTTGSSSTKESRGSCEESGNDEICMLGRRLWLHCGNRMEERPFQRRPIRRLLQEWREMA